MKIDNKKICLLMMFLLLVVCTMIFNKSSIEGHEDLNYDPDDAEKNPHSDDISPVQITPGFEDLYQLKTETWPPVSTIQVEHVQKETDELVDGKCPPCPPCARCPEPSFECKKVPNYNVDNKYLPRPVLNDFSNFSN